MYILKNINSVLLSVVARFAIVLHLRLALVDDTVFSCRISLTYTHLNRILQPPIRGTGDVLSVVQSSFSR